MVGSVPCRLTGTAEVTDTVLRASYNSQKCNCSAPSAKLMSLAGRGAFGDTGANLKFGGLYEE